MEIKVVSFVITQPFRELRCPDCGELLGKYRGVFRGEIELKCKKKKCKDNPFKRFTFNN